MLSIMGWGLEHRSVEDFAIFFTGTLFYFQNPPSRKKDNRLRNDDFCEAAMIPWNSGILGLGQFRPKPNLGKYKLIMQNHH